MERRRLAKTGTLRSAAVRLEMRKRLSLPQTDSLTDTKLAPELSERGTLITVQKLIWMPAKQRMELWKI